MFEIDWGAIITNVLIAVLPVLAASVAAWFGAQARAVWVQWSEAKPDVANVVHDFAVAAVKAAEQAGLAGLVEDKKAYALAQVQMWVAKYGLEVEVELIDAAIEQAVGEVLNWGDIFPDQNPDMLTIENL